MFGAQGDNKTENKTTTLDKKLESTNPTTSFGLPGVIKTEPKPIETTIDTNKPKQKDMTGVSKEEGILC